MSETRFYLSRTTKSDRTGDQQELVQKLKYATYNFGFGPTNDEEAPTFFDKEEEATSMATALNTIYRITKAKSYVDVFREEVKVTKVTDNNPDKVAHDVETEETENGTSK